MSITNERPHVVTVTPAREQLIRAGLDVDARIRPVSALSAVAAERGQS